MTSTGSVGSIAFIALEQLEPLLARRRVARVVEVDERHVEVRSLERGDELGRRGGGGDVEALAAQQQLQRVEDVDLIVGDQDAARSELDMDCWGSSVRI